MVCTLSKLNIGQSFVLSEIIEVDSEQTSLELQRLIPNRVIQTGVYDSLHSLGELKSKLKLCSGEVFKDYGNHYRGLKLYDVGIGTPETVSDITLKRLVQSRLIPADTQVHFRCLYGGLFLFILTDEIEIKYLKSDQTYITVDLESKEIFGCRIGLPPHPNKVWMKLQYDGKISTLVKTLSIPYLTSYCLTTSENFYSEDIPY